MEPNGLKTTERLPTISATLVNGLKEDFGAAGPFRLLDRLFFPPFFGRSRFRNDGLRSSGFVVKNGNLFPFLPLAFNRRQWRLTPLFSSAEP
jgi:hypothetical protein